MPPLDVGRRVQKWCHLGPSGAPSPITVAGAVDVLVLQRAESLADAKRDAIPAFETVRAHRLRVTRSQATAITPTRGGMRLARPGPMPQDNLEVPVVSPALYRSHAMHRDSEAASFALREQEAELLRQKTRRQHQQARAFSVGRVLLGMLFVVSALVKMSTFGVTRDALANGGIADSTFVLSAGITIELVLGALLMAGLQTRLASMALIGYLACATVLVLHDLSSGFNATFAMNNVGLCGGLLMLVGHGGGTWSVERLLEHRRARQFRA